MAQDMSPARPDAEGFGFSLFVWGAFAVALVVGGLLLAARAADDYMTVSGFLFALFGVFWASRIVTRLLP
ncbi:hypothetical protein CR162_18285 [Pseudoroseomonas rhizosphaerae]|uniref:Uncharacterized protein n=1 Tax=Teichococcus rhizosphaerae TaxID=1335062 RepID=A0A2C7A0B6_9PROT|nr:hypothetical protein [Pseudoroseomonas rhizosphaerae]PHK93498.1 hypothetical protein CR162_18285 [Pseudoroseomonas rhizosphaerae]